MKGGEFLNISKPGPQPQQSRGRSAADVSAARERAEREVGMFPRFSTVRVVAGLVVLAAVGATPPGRAVVGYAQAGLSATGRWVEDELVPWEWKIEREADAIEQIAQRRAGLMVTLENLRKERGELEAAGGQRDGERQKLEKAVSQVAAILTEMRSCSENARVIGGKAVAAQDLAAQKAAMERDLREARAGVDKVQAQIAAVDRDRAGLSADISNLKKAEDERKQTLATAIRDEKVLAARLDAARARIAARGQDEMPGRSSAIERSLDKHRAEMIRFDERLADSGASAAPAYAVSLADLNAEAAKIARK